MKVTDTHDTAAGHFDYLDAEVTGAAAPIGGLDRTPTGTQELVELVEATGPVRTETGPVSATVDQLTAHSA